MDQPLTTVSAAMDQAASNATDQTSPFGRASATLRSLGAARLLVLGATALGLFGLFAFLLLRVSEPHFTLLYGELELEDSAAIVRRLEALGVAFPLQGDGRAILVPADQAPRLRMTLAEEGLPRGGTVGGEIFDQQSALGATDFLANANLRRALEGELARTIASLAAVRAARVHLVLPRRELFRRNQIEPSASVTLHMYGGRRLDHREVQAVHHLLAAAVPGLSPARIALVDHQGTLLARGADGELEGAFPTEADELRQDYETRLPFSAAPAGDPPQSWWQLTKYDLMRLAEVAAPLVVALMLIMLVARPMIARLLAPATAGAAPRAWALPSAAGRPALAPPQRSDALATVDVDSVGPAASS